ncbi:MAG TPA: 4Fe-4S binding protein [bacterium]|nr:4Fe-4S binding protein [bacterium]
MQTARRISQILFLLFFFVLFLLAAYPYHSVIPSELFLRLDPLLGLTTSIAARRIIGKTLIAIPVLAVTVIMGRLFCGWFCPLGTGIDASDSCVARKRPNQAASALFRLRWLKYAVFIAVLTAAFFSFQLAAYLDPIPLFTRTVVTFIYPLFVFIVDGFIGFMYAIPFLEETSFRVHTFLVGKLLPVQMATFQGGVLFGIFFVGILFLAALQKRFWCRNLCPLGALLGLFSRFRLYRRRVSDACTSCALCFKSCRMGAIGPDFKSTDQAECINCMDCEVVCPVDAIHFGFSKKAVPSPIDLDRRRVLGSAVAGFLTLGIFSIGFRNTVQNHKVVRPPGSVPEPAFLDRCVRCGACVRICATSGSGLQLTGLESGWEGLATPALVTPMGYCEYHCNLCGKICPTGAIRPLAMEEKHRIKMGTAHFDKTRCIPWYYGDNCMVCEEHCPVPDKAIKFTEQTVATIDGKTATVYLPYVDESLCIGCGICTKVCPVLGERGIFLTSDGEERREA